MRCGEGPDDLKSAQVTIFVASPSTTYRAPPLRQVSQEVVEGILWVASRWELNIQDPNQEGEEHPSIREQAGRRPFSR